MTGLNDDGRKANEGVRMKDRNKSMAGGKSMRNAKSRKLADTDDDDENENDEAGAKGGNAKKNLNKKRLLV